MWIAPMPATLHWASEITKNLQSFLVELFSTSACDSFCISSCMPSAGCFRGRNNFRQIIKQARSSCQKRNYISWNSSHCSLKWNVYLSCTYQFIWIPGPILSLQAALMAFIDASSTRPLLHGLSTTGLRPPPSSFSRCWHISMVQRSRTVESSIASCQHSVYWKWLFQRGWTSSGFTLRRR